jgi:N-methylhydantoinase A
MPSIGIDVGGTFTDFVAVDDEGRVAVLKQLTTPADPSVAVLEGSRRLSEEAGAAPGAADRIIHGTTLVANSLIERRGAQTALVTTAGFRDTLEIGRESRYDLYDLDLERPEPLVPRPLRLEIRERVRADGSVLEQLDVAAAERLARELRELGVESLAIALLNAYANPLHEQQLAEIIGREAGDVDVTLSSAVAPEWREYERTSTAAANAFVKPLVRRYLARLEEGFEELGAEGRLYVVLSQGGITSATVAAELAIQLVESGPAGGVMAASFFGRRLGLDDLISFDMGGTTTKVSLIEGGLPLQVPELEVARVARFKRGSGLPLKIPAIELVEIGAGGGSLGRIDALGLLKVGPQSAGADPGPACYGRGGTEPTVTDADLALGLLDPSYFLGGAMSLDRERADEALARLGARIGLDADACARGIFDIVNGQMALALQTHVIERGEDPRGYALVAFGGAGPVHAYEVARRLGISRIVCPPAAGVASAVGFLVAPFAVDLARTHPRGLGSTDWDGVADRFREMEHQARGLLARAGASLDDLAIERSVDMRYAGQGYTVPVTLPDGPLTDELETPLREAFQLAYERRFGSHLKTAPAEALHWRLSAHVPVAPPNLVFAQATEGDPVKGEREAYFPEIGGFTACPVYDRYRFGAGLRVSGPALIEERESTIVVGPSAEVEADDFGNLLIRLGAP